MQNQTDFLTKTSIFNDTADLFPKYFSPRLADINIKRQLKELRQNEKS